MLPGSSWCYNVPYCIYNKIKTISQIWPLPQSASFTRVGSQICPKVEKPNIYNSYFAALSSIVIRYDSMPCSWVGTWMNTAFNRSDLSCVSARLCNVTRDVEILWRYLTTVTNSDVEHCEIEIHTRWNNIKILWCDQAKWVWTKKTPKNSFLINYILQFQTKIMLKIP